MKTQSFVATRTGILSVVVAAILGGLELIVGAAMAATTTNGDVLVINISVATDNIPSGAHLNLGLVSTLLADGGCAGQRGACVESSAGGFGPRAVGSVTYTGSYLYSTGPFLSLYTLIYRDIFGTFDVTVRADLCNGSGPCSFDNLFAGVLGWDGISVDYELNPATLPKPTNLFATPIPGALPLFATGLGIFGGLGWHRKRGCRRNPA
jgi:hypothetical protein